MKHRIIVYYPPFGNPLVGKVMDDKQSLEAKEILANMGVIDTLTIYADNGSIWYIPKEVVKQSIICLEVQSDRPETNA